MQTDQYLDDRNLRARQRLWDAQRPQFDLVGWVLGLVEINAGVVVLDVGCGPGTYLRRLSDVGATAVGLDLSLGIMPTGQHPLLVNADAVQLPFRADTFDIVLAPHMLYHVASPGGAAQEIRRVLRDAGTFVAVTNGARHIGALVDLVAGAVHQSNPDWTLCSPATEAFSLENGAAQLRGAFESVDLVRPDRPPRVALTDARIAADYVASIGDSYENQINRPWSEVVEAVHIGVQAVIERNGAFVVEGDPGAFVCR